MIILDTNVLSALMARTRNPQVEAWLDHCPADDIWITTITVFEVLSGISLLADSVRRHAVAAEFERAKAAYLKDRILLFDETAAHEAGKLYPMRLRAGRTIEIRDTFLAGIAISRGATLATRNVRHFSDLPIPVVDPWTA
jgi:predicted nucleic acid-binding protein